MLSPRIRQLLALQQVEVLANSNTGRARLDDIVDEPANGGREGIAEDVDVFLLMLCHILFSTEQNRDRSLKYS